MTDFVIDDTTAYIEQKGSETSPYQWLRELVMNSLEAGAGSIRVEPYDDVLFHAYGVEKMAVIDNGEGMTGPKLVEYMKSLLHSGKSFGTAGAHQGIGARITTMQWNKAGVVVISLRDGEMNLVWMWKDPSTGRYGLRDFDIEEDSTYTNHVTLSDYDDDLEIDGVPWTQVVPDWVKKAGHGTVVVLLGNEEDELSILGDQRLPGEGWIPAKPADVGTKYTTARRNQLITSVGEKRHKPAAEWNYLSKRFWVLQARTYVKGYGIWEVDPSNSAWNAGRVRTGGIKSGGTGVTWDGKPTSTSDDMVVRGALDDIFNKPKGLKVTHGTVELDHPNLPARVHWFLRDGSPTDVGYRDEVGYIGALYQDELYERHHQFRKWGVPYKAIQDRVFLVAEPLAAVGPIADVKGTAGVRPNSERSRLLWGEDNSSDLPWDEWGAMFRSEGYMPTEILDAIKAYVATLPASAVVDPETIRRVMEHVDHTYETDDVVVRRKAGSPDLFKGTRDLWVVDPDGKGEITRLGRKRRGPRKPRRPGTPREDGTAPTGRTKCIFTTPTKITATRKKDEGGPLVNKKGKVPGVVKPAKGGPPKIEWVMQSDLIDQIKGDETNPDFVGALWDDPSTINPSGLLRLAKDHRFVESVITRFAEDLTHIPETEIRQVVQDAIAGAALVRVLTIRKNRGMFGGTDTVSKMLSPHALTGMLILSSLEYDNVRHRLVSKFSAKPKTKITIAKVI